MFSIASAACQHMISHAVLRATGLKPKYHEIVCLVLSWVLYTVNVNRICMNVFLSHLDRRQFVLEGSEFNITFVNVYAKQMSAQDSRQSAQGWFCAGGSAGVLQTSKKVEN